MFWALNYAPTTFGNTFLGATFSFLMGQNSTHLGWRPCVGQSGTAATKLPLKRKKLRTPFDIVFSACGYITYWAGLMSEADREAMEHGAKMLRTNASTMMRICTAPGGVMED